MIESEVGKFLAVRYGGEATAQVVGPGVIGTHDFSGTMTGTAVHQPRRAMTTHIEKGLHAAVLAAHRNQGFAQEIQRVVIAGIGYVVEVAHRLPRRGKYPLLLSFQKIRIPIDPTRETESFEGCGRALCLHVREPTQVLLNASITRASVPN